MTVHHIDPAPSQSIPLPLVIPLRDDGAAPPTGEPPDDALETAEVLARVVADHQILAERVRAKLGGERFAELVNAAKARRREAEQVIEQLGRGAAHAQYGHTGGGRGCADPTEKAAEIFGVLLADSECKDADDDLHCLQSIDAGDAKTRFVLAFLAEVIDITGGALVTRTRPDAAE